MSGSLICNLGGSDRGSVHTSSFLRIKSEMMGGSLRMGKNSLFFVRGLRLSGQW